MVKLALAVCLIIGVTTINVVRGEEVDVSAISRGPAVEPDLWEKYNTSVDYYVLQCRDLVKPFEDQLDKILALDTNGNEGNNSISTMPVIGPIIECSKAFASSIIKPVKSLIGAVILLYAHARAYFDGILDCVKTNGLVAPVALPVCFTKYSSYAVIGTVQTEIDQILHAVKEILGFATGNWIAECLAKRSQ